MMKAFSRKLVLGCSTAVVALLLTTSAMAQQREFDIPAQDANKAVAEFAHQSGVQIIASGQQLRGLKTKAIKGSIDTRKALSAMLEGTGLVVASDDGAIITLKKAKSPQASGPSAGASEELVVTGTHIRNANPTSPVHTIGRKDIEQSGYSQIGDVMRSLPENFSGGQNPGVVAASGTNADNQNYSNASTINLRGLGTDATLVLLNGRRLAADSYYQGVDISGIPLSAVQRIEVVTDGASALYGADAVAGVANIITRKNFRGGQFDARVGGATQGAGLEQTYSLLQGLSKGTWYALTNLEYSKQNEIAAGDRAFTRDAPADATLIRPQTRQSLYLSAGGNLSENVKLSMDGLVSDRDQYSINHFATTSTRFYVPIYNSSYTFGATLDINLPKDWNLHITGSTARGRNAYKLFYATGRSRTFYRNALDYFEVTSDGTLLTLPSGEVKIAVGGGQRKEYFTRSYPGSSTYIDASREVSYAFAEAHAPLAAPSDTRKGLHALEISLSGRVEKYSDFGSTTTPKVGIRYVPFNGVVLRSTWGKSFKAPSFSQMYQQETVYYYAASRFGYTGGGTALETYGGNPDLKPERSTSWTFSGDYVPPTMRTIKLTASYFNVDYTDRVIQPINPITTALSNPVFAPYVEWTPTTARMAEVVAGADIFVNGTTSAYNPASVVAIFHEKYQNATAQSASGVDLGYRQAFTLSRSNLDVFANGTWSRLTQQTIPTQPSYVLSGTVFNVPEFKGRAGVSWTKDGLVVSSIVNYISGGVDNGVKPQLNVSNWTTVDANLAYTFRQSQGFAQGLRLGVSVSNLFDRDPPRVMSPAAVGNQGIYFDSTNSSIIGRFVSINLVKSW